MGKVFDDAGQENGTGEAKPEESVNGTEVKPDTEVNDAESQPGAESAPDGGTEDPAAGEGAGGDEGAAGKEGAPAVPDTVAALQAQVAELQKKLEETLTLKPKTAEEPTPKPVELTEEEWAQREQALGIPRTAIKHLAKQGEFIYNRVMDGVEKILNERLGGIEKSSALGKLAKEPGYEDAARYQKEVDEFLADFDRSHHSNPALLKKAVVYARGLNVKKDLNKVRNEGDRNKVIAGTGRPAAPSGGARAKTAPLSPLERQAAQLMGGEAEYRKWKPSNGAAVIER